MKLTFLFFWYVSFSFFVRFVFQGVVEYGHQRHALKEERAKEMAKIEVEIASLESERAELATLYANVQLELTSLKTDIKAKHAEKATVCEKYLHRMQELEAQFVASKVVES